MDDDKCSCPTKVTKASGQRTKQIVTSFMWSILENARLERRLECGVLAPCIKAAGCQQQQLLLLLDNSQLVALAETGDGCQAALASRCPVVVLLTNGLQVGSVFPQVACRIRVLSDLGWDRTNPHVVGQVQHAWWPQPGGTTGSEA